jgi:hypothetical protein
VRRCGTMKPLRRRCLHFSPQDWVCDWACDAVPSTQHSQTHAVSLCPRPCTLQRPVASRKLPQAAAVRLLTVQVA